MRELKADLEICNKATPGPWEQVGCNVAAHGYTLFVTFLSGKTDAEFIAQAREGWPYAIERAIKAEAEVERLNTELSEYTISDEEYDGGTSIYSLRQELKRLRDENKSLRKFEDMSIEALERAIIAEENYKRLIEAIQNIPYGVEMIENALQKIGGGKWTDHREAELAKYKRAFELACQFSTDPEQTKKAWLKQAAKEGKE